MKRICSALLAFCLAVSLCGMGAYAEGSQETEIALSDAGVTVNGAPASSDSASAVYVGADIVYYHDGTDASYGEGTEQEMHSAEEAAAHTVVTITQPGTYRVTGTLSLGQLAVDLGEDAAEDPDAVVTLILDNVDITCTVAPAVIFYNVYECGSTDLETAQAVVDTTAAGANVILAEGSVNNVTGSHVARIYKEGTTKKLHKYDGAFYSKMSMNISGEGTLNITADNEGLDTELHLTINGGVININSQDDGINTNEDGVSVTTINGGTMTIQGGLGSEGDGIDSNGFLVINGGTVWTTANERSGDGGVDADSDILINGGVDADSDILINGGNVYAFGSRNDAASSDSAQPYLELSFASTLPAGTQLMIADSEGNTVTELTLDRACQSVTPSQQDTPFVIGETYESVETDDPEVLQDILDSDKLILEQTFEAPANSEEMIYFTHDVAAISDGLMGQNWEDDTFQHWGIQLTADADWVMAHEGERSTTGFFTIRSYEVERLDWGGEQELLLATAREVNNLKACAPTLLTAAFGSLAVFLAAAFLLSGQLWKTEERQRRLEEERRELTAALAHDLKTPLAAIQGYAELLEQGSAPEREEAYRAGLRAQTAKMDRLLGEMLELSRLEDGGLTLRTEEVDLGALADGLLAQYEAAAREKKITLCRTGEGTVKGDPGLLERALDNLLSNAVRHCAEGGRVTVALSPGRCAVRNTGETLAEEVLARMWDPYYKGDDTRQGGRAGLGLTIVRRICTLHGFTWGAENGEEGPEVWFRWDQP